MNCDVAPPIRLRSFDVVIKGGKPWGFQLAGGTDVNGPPLVISQVECGGKVEAMGSLHVGDQLLRVNDVFCSSLSMAEQLVESAFRTLTLTVWRGNVETHGGRPSAQASSSSSSSPAAAAETLSSSPVTGVGGEQSSGAAGARGAVMEESHDRTSTSIGGATTTRTLSSGADIRVSRTASSCGESMRMKEWRQRQQQQQQKLQQPRYVHHLHSDAGVQQPLRQPPSHHQQQQQQQQQQALISSGGNQQMRQRRNSLVGGDQRERSHSFHESPRLTATNQRPLPGHYGVQQQQQQHCAAWNSAATNVNTRKINSKTASSEMEVSTESIYENVTLLRHSQPQFPLQKSAMDGSTVSLSSTSGSGAPSTTTTTTEVVIQRLRPALERERRSLRKLTKDSGYETSPYSESDYANMEWLSDQNSEHGVVSPSPTHGRHPGAASAAALCAYWDTASSDQEGGPYPMHQYHKASSTQYRTQRERSYLGRSAQSAVSRSKSAIYADTLSYVVDYPKDRTVTTSSSDALRRLSQGNVWLAQQQQQQLHHHDPFQGRYSSTDSLCSSYSSSTSGGGRCFNRSYNHHQQQQTATTTSGGKVVGAKSTPSLHHGGLISCGVKGVDDVSIAVQSSDAASVVSAFNLVTSMNNSRSTPNLDKETSYAVDCQDQQTEIMVSRKFKKASVYEALANKSGLDFAPSIQGRIGPDGYGHPSSHGHQQQHQHQRSTSNSSFSGVQQQQQQLRYHCRHISSQSTASDCTSSSGNSQSHHSRQESGQSSYSEDDSRVMSPRSEESDCPVFTYHGSVSLQSFPSDRYDAEDLLDDHWNSVECDSYLPSLMGSPPPPIPPVRDGSSLKYMTSSDYHDKYPSWPVSADQLSNCSAQQQRSSTASANAADLASEKAVAYARLRKYAQSYTHQLKTVMEKSERMTAAAAVAAATAAAAAAAAAANSNANAAAVDDPRLITTAYMHSMQHDRAVAPQFAMPLGGHVPQSVSQPDVSLDKYDRHQQQPPQQVRKSSTVDQVERSSRQRGGSEYPSSDDCSRGVVDDTPLLDRLRLESKHWSSDCGLDNVKRGGGRDSITSTTSSQETLKWHGSSGDVSVCNSDKQASRSSTVEGGVVHSARVKPPQRHNSESVLYYGTEEPPIGNDGLLMPLAGCRAVRRVKPNKRDSPSSSQHSAATSSTSSRKLDGADDVSDDQAPPLPRKVRQQWSDQVQKNNYINQIQMQIRPLADGTGSGIRTGSLAREEIQPPVSPEFAKPLSVAERIQDLERQARSGGGGGTVAATAVSGAGSGGGSRQPATSGNGGCADKERNQRSPYVLVAGLSSQKLPNGATTTSPDGLSAEMRTAYLDPEKKHKVSDPELKAIQKQAVLSFFERQMGIATGKGTTALGGSGRMSRRLAQSLPRDYFQDFKRMQQAAQDNDKRNNAARAASGSSPRKPVVCQEGSSDSVIRTSPSSSTRLTEKGASPSRRHEMQRHVSTDRQSSSSTPATDSPTTKSSKDQSFTAKHLQLNEECTAEHANESIRPDQKEKHESVRSDEVGAHRITTTNLNGVFAASAVSISAPVICERSADVAGPLASSREAIFRNRSRMEEQLDVRCGSTADKALMSNGYCDASDVGISPIDPPEEQLTGRLVQCVLTDDDDDDDDVASVAATDNDHGNCSSAESCASKESNVDHFRNNAVLKIEESDPVVVVQSIALGEGTSAGSTPHTRRRPLMVADKNGISLGSSSSSSSRGNSSSSSNNSSNSVSPIANIFSQSSRCSTPDLPLPPPPNVTSDDVAFISNEPLPPPPSFGEMSWDPAVVATVENDDNQSPNGSCLSPYRREPQSPPGVDTDNSRPTTRLLTNGNNMDAASTVSPNTWEQWHNIRQSNTTLVFHSSEMLSSKPSHLKPLSRNGSPPRTSSSSPSEFRVDVKSHSPPQLGFVIGKLSSSPSRGSTESLRSSASGGSSTPPSSSTSSLTTGDMRLLQTESLANDRLNPPSADVNIGSGRISGGTNNNCAGVFIEATTQTTPSVTGGKIGRRKRDEELECERLSLDLVNHLSGHDTALRHILVSPPNMKTMADYMEGVLDVDDVVRGDEDGGDDGCNAEQRQQQANRLSKSSKLSSSCSSLSSGDHTMRLSSDSVPLPSDSAYFTTSESKARFLTRYNLDMMHRSPLEAVSTSSELTKKKEELVDSITRKLEILRKEHLAIREEIRFNNELGSSVTHRVEQLARPNEVDKFKLHVEEVEKITNLLLGLSGRLARAENALVTLPLDANADDKRLLEAKRNKLLEQHEEAKKLKENIDRRSCQVSLFLRKYFSSDEYADYDHFVKMRVKLLVDFREIDDKIKLGEEQMAALELNLRM